MKIGYAVTALAFAAFTALLIVMLLGTRAEGSEQLRVGLGVSVDSRWIAVEGFYCVRDRGAAARVPAWASEVLSRGPATAYNEGSTVVRTVRLGSVPNVPGRIERGAATFRAVAGAAFTVVRYIVTNRGIDSTTTTRHDAEGATNADRR